MVVTEIAILRSHSGVLDTTLREELKTAQSIQAEWHAEAFPTSPSTIAERGDAMFQQLEDPGSILLTTRWDSVPAHWQWIKSDKNQKIMNSLRTSIVSEGHDAFVLLHVDSEIFCSPAPPGYIHLLDSPVISVERMFLSSKDRGAFTTKFTAVKHMLEDFAWPHLVRGGWRVDNEVGGTDEFILVCGWDTVENHQAFTQASGFGQYWAIRSLLVEPNTMHFKRFL
jgi:heme-degrading monooxygenase HmoA